MAYENVDLGFVADLERHRSKSYFRPTGDDKWEINDSGVEDYAKDVNFPEFGGFNAMPRILDEFIDAEADNIAIDIAGGANGVALQQLISAGLIAKGLVTNLEDTRNLRARASSQLSHIAGDLCEFPTWAKIVNWARINAPEGVDLILSRPRGALQHLPIGTYGGATVAFLEMLKPGGILYAQIPWSLSESAPNGKNSKKLDRVCARIQSSGLAGRIIKSSSDTRKGDYAVIIQRH